MTEPADGNWDELGIAWRAVEPDFGAISSRLRDRLRRQSRWMTAGLMVGLPACGAGVLLGAWTLAAGISSATWNFATRGIAIIAMSSILASALWMLLSVRSLTAANSLAGMIDLAIRRSHRGLNLIRAAVCSLAVAALCGLAGTALRMHLSGPPKMSPVVDLLVVALLATVLILCGRQVQARESNYRRLKSSLFTP